VYLTVDSRHYERNLAAWKRVASRNRSKRSRRAWACRPARSREQWKYYNRFAARGEDPLFHKVPALLQPLTNALRPIDCRPEKVAWATLRWWIAHPADR